MAITINGSGTIAGISQGGLNDNIITQAELATTGVAGNGPAFSAYMNTSQAFNAATWTKLQFNIESFDTASCFDTTTYRFTPNVAGYYQVNGSWMTGTASNYIGTAIYKNGSEYARAWTGNAYGMSCPVNSLIYFNGSTDYVELYGNNTAANSSTATGPIYSWFNAALVRAA